MFRRIRLTFFKALVFILAIHSGMLNAQLRQPDKGEEMITYWGEGLENARQQLSISRDEFSLFCRYDETKLDTLRAMFMRNGELKNNKPLAIQDKIMLEESQVVALYEQFENIKKQYPSSVDEYKRPYHRLTSICDTSGCDNIGFEFGNLSGWNAYYGYNNNTGSFGYFNITNISGGPAGPVTEAADDVLTSTSGFYSTFLGPNPSPDYQVSIMSGVRYDALISTLPVVSPYGGSYSVMLGDSTEHNYGVAILSKTFEVKPNNTDFTYQYAVVLEDPIAHSYFEQPFFQVAILDQNGDTIPICGQYSVVASGGKADGFTPVYVPPNGTIGNDTAYYKNWTVVCVPLKKYVGQCVTIIFEAGDCSLSGHFGYAYVDATCSPLTINASSPGLCGQKSITLTGPPGFTKYKWQGPTHGIIGTDTTQSIAIDSEGTYNLIAIPVTGLACADTLSITIHDTTGPPPIPSFTASIACAGQTVKFTNTSTPAATSGAKFYWDFYDLGTYQDSSANPTWTYSTPGTYYVKLYEMYHGCGSDTVIPIIIYPPPTVYITAPPVVCMGDSVTLSATVTSSYLPFCFYNWSTGQPTRTIKVFPIPPDTDYYVVVTSGCSDTTWQSIHVVNTNPIHACCDTTMLAGDTTTLLAWDEQKYYWTPNDNLSCADCASTLAYPRQSSTYIVTGIDSNGCVFHDTIHINIENCADVFIPKAFTPNHNGINDTFFPVGHCLESYEMYIFDRWGNMLYSTTTSQPWDGTYKGKKVQEDTYVYQVVAYTWDGNQQTIIGAVTVLR